MRLTRIVFEVHGKKPVYSREDFEIYGIIKPEELPGFFLEEHFIKIKKVEKLSDFAVWCDLDNNIEHGGTVVFHPQNHVHLINNGKLTSFIGLDGDTPIATCGILDNNGIASLEFVSVLPDYRKKGVAKALCKHALVYAFSNGAKVITTRAIGDGRALCKSLGFHIIVN